MYICTIYVQCNIYKIYYLVYNVYKISMDLFWMAPPMCRVKIVLKLCNNISRLSNNDVIHSLNMNTVNVLFSRAKYSLTCI